MIHQANPATDIKAPTATAAPDPIAVSKSTAAAMFDCSARSWQKYSAAGLIPEPVRFNGRPRWILAELQDWAAAGCPSRARWMQMTEGRYRRSR